MVGSFLFDQILVGFVNRIRYYYSRGLMYLKNRNRGKRDHFRLPFSWIRSLMVTGDCDKIDLSY